MHLEKAMHEMEEWFNSMETNLFWKLERCTGNRMSAFDVTWWAIMISDDLITAGNEQ